MGVRLTVKMKSGSGAESKTVLLDEELITFGRDQTCQVVLAQQAVSRNHARISRDGTLFFLEDLGSSFGTQVNGQKLPKGEKRLLRNGDIIAIAQFDVTFDRVADVSTEENDNSNKTSFLSRKLVKDAMNGLAANGENAYFRIMNGSAEGQRIEIADAQEYIFGRDASEADIVLNDDLVSRKHVKVRRDWSGTHVEDLGSRNGIKLNKKRTRKATIKDRDELEIGGVRLLFIDPSEVREDPLVLPSSNDEEESTRSVKADESEAESASDSPPSVEVKQQEVEPPPEEPAPPAEDPPTDSEAPADENLEQPADQPSVEEPPPPDEEAPAEGPRKLVDFSNKQHLIALAIGGVMVIMGVVLIVMLLAGA